MCLGIIVGHGTGAAGVSRQASQCACESTFSLPETWSLKGTAILNHGILSPAPIPAYFKHTKEKYEQKI